VVDAKLDRFAPGASGGQSSGDATVGSGSPAEHDERGRE
jgi:hypothetical protein